MNMQLPLTDHAIRAAIARRATSAEEGNLREDVLAATSVVPQRRIWRVRLGEALPLPERRATLALATAVLLLIAIAIGAAVVGRLVDRTTPAPLGGLAYLSEGDVYLAGPAGESPRLIWDIPASEDLASRHLVWLDPETVLLQLYSEVDEGVHLVNITTGEHRLLDTGSYVALSPNGRQLATLRYEDGASPPERLRLIEIASNALVAEFATSIRAYPHSWSPDGRWLLGEMPDHIYKVDVASGARTVLATDLCCGLSLHSPAWSPDSTWIVYVDYHEATSDCLDRCGTLWSVPAGGGEPTRLTPELGSEMLPAVSPDGRWIAYVEESTSGLIVIAADGSAARTAGPDWLHGPVRALVRPQIRWDPDSGGVTYLSPGANLWHVTLAALEGTPIELPPISEFARQVVP